MGNRKGLPLPSCQIRTEKIINPPGQPHRDRATGSSPMHRGRCPTNPPHPQRHAPRWTGGRRGKGMGVGGVGPCAYPAGRFAWLTLRLPCCYCSHSERHSKSSCPIGSTCAIPLASATRLPLIAPISYTPTSAPTRLIASASAPILPHPDTSISPPTSFGSSISRVRRRLAFLIVRFNI